MLHRFGHGHSLALGALLTLALERHMLLAALLLYAAGVATGRGWARLRTLGGLVAERLRTPPRPTAKRKAR